MKRKKLALVVSALLFVSVLASCGKGGGLTKNNVITTADKMGTEAGVIITSGFVQPDIDIDSGAIISTTDSEDDLQSTDELSTIEQTTVVQTTEATTVDPMANEPCFTSAEDAVDEYIRNIQNLDFEAILRNLSYEEAMALIDYKNLVAPRIPANTPDELRDWAVRVDSGPHGYYSSQGSFYYWYDNPDYEDKIISWKIEKKETLTEEEKKKFEKYITDTKVDEIVAFTISYVSVRDGVETEHIANDCNHYDSRTICCRRGENWSVMKPYSDIHTMIHMSGDCWAELYLEYVRGKNYPQQDFSYKLVYLDDDEIPELYINTVFMGSWELVYYDPDNKSGTAEDGLSVFSASFSSFSYLEREGIFRVDQAQSGAFSDTIYTFKDGIMTKIGYGDGGYTPGSDDRTIEYRWEGADVSKEEYEASIERIFDVNRAVSPTDRMSFHEFWDYLDINY
ncbi:MAG: YgdI/YgdR family lipoprotein [Eubacterium sp.]|nr:YgdI/YgdR family lipoprotein [Eubacterium sp.]